MKLFRWHSNALKNYGKGHIIVMAENVKDARNKALLFIVNVLLDPNGDYNYLDEEQIIEKKNEFVKDIDAEPEIVNDEVVLISGSE
jgi:hypothetical protein